MMWRMPLDLNELNEFLAKEIAEVDSWTGVPTLYSSGYHSAMLVVQKFLADREKDPTAAGDEVLSVPGSQGPGRLRSRSTQQS
jgi:hypothetical protein